MNKRIRLLIAILIPVLVIGGILLEEDEQTSDEQEQHQEPESPAETPIDIEGPEQTQDFPKISSWLAKKEELIESQKPYDLVMSGWFTPVL